MRPAFRYVLLGLAVILLVRPPAVARRQDATTSPPLPPPGRLIDLGGWRVHLHCTGEVRPSQPTVILEAGSGDLSVDWSLVQPDVVVSRVYARTTAPAPAGVTWVRGRAPCARSCGNCERCSKRPVSAHRMYSSGTHLAGGWSASSRLRTV